MGTFRHGSAELRTPDRQRATRRRISPHVTISYVLAVDDPDVEPYPLDHAVTIGRHLDNDLVLAGEDVRDFHLRVELGERGPRVTALEHATAHVGDRVVDEPHGVMPGDEIVIGHHHIRVEISDAGPSWGWTIHDMREPNALALDEEVLVGRGDPCRLQLREGHVSRRHALLKRVGNTVWVKDLGSSNGTFVNGERVVGARRMFHGDEVAFDLFRYQLIGDDPELTPIRPPGAAPTDPFAESFEQAIAPAEGIAPAPRRNAQAEQAVERVAPSVSTSAPVLVEARGEGLGRMHPLRLGRQVLGRAVTADVRLNAPDVAERHAEIDLRADGAALIHLAPGATTKRNGSPVNTAKLEHGDVLEIGAVRLTFHSKPVAPDGRRVNTLLIGAVVIAIVAVGLWVVLAA